MVGMEPRGMPVAVLSRLRVVVSLLLALGVLTTAAWGRDLSGAWISPDWYFPGPRVYSEAEVRTTAREAMAKLAAQGVDTVFLETFLRGNGICKPIHRDSAGRPSVLTAQDRPESFPVYRHLAWNYRTEFDTVLDPLQIFIEEGQLVGIEVHAWVHLFYWRMDNTDIMLSWHNGDSVWAELMEIYLRRQAQRLELLAGRSVRPGYEQADQQRRGREISSEVLNKAADIFAQGCDVRALAALLRENGFRSEGRPIGVLIAEILKAGGERPDFLLVASDEDPFPAPRGKVLRPIYVDPAHPKVREKLRAVIQNIATSHPGLAGVHLDHVRYPVDGQGLSRETGVEDGSYHVYSASDPRQMAQYKALTSALSARREALATLVSEIRAGLSRGMRLSAAVLPLYYRDRDNGKFRTSGYDYSAQAWLDWPVDFVVPMMYEYHPYLIRTLVKDYQAQAVAANPRRPITVFPGISRFEYTRNGSVDGSLGWVFFDLTLARDVNVQARETEDLDFGGE